MVGKLTFCDGCGTSTSYKWFCCDACKISLCSACGELRAELFAEDPDPCTHLLAERTQQKSTINISAVTKKHWCLPLVEMVADELGHLCEEKPDDAFSYVYYVWDNQAMLRRIPKLRPQAWVSRMPGMSNLCDKVNMTLALKLLEQLRPTPFFFWPQCWLLPEVHPNFMALQVLSLLALIVPLP